MPLSRLDLPHIIEAVEELHRAIANPPTENWRAPAWLVEQYKQTTLGEAGVPKKPTHAGLIHAAATEVLNRIMPPWHHTKDDCPEITESLLDMRHKVALLDLRERLSTFALVGSPARNRSEAFKALAYLESVLDQLRDEPPVRAAGAPRDQGRAGQDAKPAAVALISAIDDLIAFVQAEPFGNTPKSYAGRHLAFDSEDYRALQRLGARFSTECQRAGLSMPAYSLQGSSFNPWGYACIPSQLGKTALLVLSTPAWEQAMLGLGAMAEARPPEGTGAPRDQGGAGQGEGSGMAPTKLDPAEREQRIGQLSKAVRRAWRSFEFAALNARKSLDDLTCREAYTLLKEVDFRDDQDVPRELADYKLPPVFSTWEKYVRNARNALGEQKNTPRRGRSHGKSIVNRNQIDQTERDE